MSKKASDDESVLEAIAAMPEHDRIIGEKIHSIVKDNAPDLSPRTWDSMPAYAGSNGKIVCFFRSSAKFGERYMTLGFNDVAKLDEGSMWPINFALTELTAAEEAKITALVKKAVS